MVPILASHPYYYYSITCGELGITRCYGDGALLPVV
jgi:hypothetical protein